jgi:hypothetical protein
MKRIVQLLSWIFIASLPARAQSISPGLAGVWKGSIITDQEVPYEVVISGEDGQFTGYSLTRFKVKGKDMIAVKKLTISSDGNTWIMADDDLLFDNFKNASARDFKQTNTLIEDKDASTPSLSGTFATRATREFRSLSGKIKLVKQPDTADIQIRTKLQDMALWNSMSFLRPPRPVVEDKPAYALSAPRPYKPLFIDYVVARPSIPVRNSRYSMPVALNIVYPSAPIPIAKVEVKIPEPKSEPVATTATAKAEMPASVTPAPVAVAPARVIKPVPTAQQPVTVSRKPVAKPVSPPVATVVQPKPVQPAAPVRNVNQNVVALSNSYMSNLKNRQIENIQSLYIQSDSLVVTLYDNGEVDGDTVSVILNGKMFMEKQGLSTRALSKTVYVTPDMGDSLQLIMYAENLGSLPPNTGLLIIMDGNTRHEIRFAGDLKKNAAITLLRKPKDK